MAREMKDSGVQWIGKIPIDWDMVPLQYYVELNKNTLGEDTPSDYEFEYVEIGAVTLEQGISEYQHYKFSDAPSRARRVVQPNDIIVSTVRTYLKAIAIVPDKENVVVSTGFAVLTPKNICTDYLGFVLKSEYFVHMVTSHSVGISYPAINSSDLVKLKIPIATEAEQVEIAGRLNKKCTEIDTILEKIRLSIEEYKKLKQAIITQTVTKGIRGDRPMKDSGIKWIGMIPANYKIYRLKHILKSALMYGANESGVPFDESLPRYIRITDITTDGKLKEIGKLSLPEEIAKEYILENNDILFARSGASVGKTFIYKKPYGRSAFAGYLIKASTNNEVEADYLFLYTQSSIYEEWKNQIFIQATIQNIGADRYNNLPIVLPSIEEQKELITHLTDKCAEIDSIIDQKTTLLSELEAYKKSIIYEYVTGKKEVPDKHESVL